MCWNEHLFFWWNVPIQLLMNDWFSTVVNIMYKTPIKLITNVLFCQTVNFMPILMRCSFSSFVVFSGPFVFSVLSLVPSLHVFPKRRERKMVQSLVEWCGRDHRMHAPISDELSSVQNKVLTMWTQQCRRSHRQRTMCQLQCQQLVQKNKWTCDTPGRVLEWSRHTLSPWAIMSQIKGKLIGA